jgi:hypothetical protein
MARPHLFHGSYVKTNEAKLREKAEQTGDPRSQFYVAMLSSDSYEEYYAKVGKIVVRPATTAYKVSAHLEMRYARDNGWIGDSEETGAAE